MPFPDYDMMEEEADAFLPFVSRPGHRAGIGPSQHKQRNGERQLHLLLPFFLIDLLVFIPPPPQGLKWGCTWQISSENLWVNVPKKAMGKKEKGVLLTSPHIFAMCK